LKKDFIIIFLGRVLQVIISFLTLKVITNYLSKDNVAYYFLFLSVMNYFGLSLISPIGQYFNRKIHTWYDDRTLVNRLLNHCIYIFGVAAISIPIMYLMMSYGNVLSGLDVNSVVGLVAVGIISNTIVTTIVPTFNMLNHRILFVVYTVLYLLFSLILSVLLVNQWGDSVINWFIGHFLSLIIFSVISFITLLKITKQNFSFKESLSVIKMEYIRKILSFSLPLLIATLLMWVTTDSFRFVLESTHGLEYVGLFSVGFAIAQRFSFATESIAQQIFFPKYYREINKDDFLDRSNAWLEMFYSSVPLYLLTTVFTILLAPLLIKIFSGPDYANSHYFVIIGAIFHFFRKITASFSMGAHSEMNTKVLIVPYFIGALFSSIILFYFGRNSFYAPGVIVVLGSIMMCLAMVVSTKKLVSFKWCRDTAKRTVNNYIKR